jgi:hypothetical protein
MATDAEVTSAISAQFVAGKNKIINGDFGIWQRGTSFSTTSSLLYTADRWWTNAFSGTATVSRQTFAAGTAPIAGYEGTYFLRFANTNTFTQLGQRIEDVRAFAGQTVSVSFWAKAASSLSLQPYLEQNFGSGGSASTYAAGTAANVTTSWQRFTATIPAASISGKTIGTSSFLNFYLLTSTLNTDIDVWGVQVEAGSTATNFTTATGTIQGELAACQRYYLLVASGVGAPIAAAWYPTSTAMSTIVNFPVEMRTSSPTLVQTTGTGYYNVYAVAGNDSLNSLTIDVRSSRACLLYNNTDASGTAGSTGNSVTNNASSHLALSAEL